MTRIERIHEDRISESLPNPRHLRSILFYFAFSFTSKTPNVLLSSSTKYPCQQRPGIANFGKAICPPFCKISSLDWSKFSTWIEQTKAF